jgi:hypothetical protein
MFMEEFASLVLNTIFCFRNSRSQNTLTDEIPFFLFYLYKKALVNKHNNILYAVPYQHFINSIENYFSMLKSILQKLEGLKYGNLKENIKKVISEIPKEKYENIFKGA